MKSLTRPLSARVQPRLLRMLAPVVAIMALLVFLAALSFNVLSSLRAFVNGESLWSKAQQHAVARLRQYAEAGDEADHAAFLESLAISQGDRAARLAIERDPPDLAAARAGFLRAGNHADDIDGMVWLYRYFRHAPHIDRAVGYWRHGDELILTLYQAGTIFHARRTAADFSAADQRTLRQTLDRLDAEFGPTEAGFSDALGMASRLTLQVLSLAIVLTAIGLLALLATFFRRLMLAGERSRLDLALSEERLRLGFQGTNCGLWDWNMVTNDVFYSPWIYKLLEYGNQISTMNDTFIEMVHPDDRGATIAAGSAHIINRVPYDIEFRIRTLTGKYFWVRSRAEAVRDASGRAVRMVGSLFDISELKAIESQACIERELAQATLSHQASHDELTGLVNRREFERRLSCLLAQPAAQRARNAVMYIDLDQLKIVNDSGGHAAGDQLIRQLSALMKQRLREGDLLARLGGDEFGVILDQCGAEDALRVAEALRELIFDTRFVWEGKAYATGLSIGLIAELDQFDAIGELMKVADAACFMAKEKGRNRVHLYHADDHELSLRHCEIEWVSRIGEALEQDRFRLYAQRIVAAGSDDKRGQHVELLLRMVDTDGKLIPPMSFIPAAERYNLMPGIDRWVIQAAFSMLAEGFANGVVQDQVTCAINLSGASMEDEHFLDFILEQQCRHGIPLSTICFEITETAAINNLPKAAAFIARLRAVGCCFSLDDFGAGMASFGYLKHLPVDFLKIDGSFVKDMMRNPIDCAMVEAINQIGHVMQKKTIAEFVEDEATLECLREIGVDYAQGFGIARPEPFHPLYLLSASRPVAVVADADADVDADADAAAVGSAALRPVLI